MPGHVSVVLPTFNRADTLRRSIGSVLEQAFGDIEIVVVDDGSTDNTKAILGSIRDERVRCISLDRNRGQSIARNAGIAACTGNLIAFQDSDDTWRGDKLARQVAVLDNNPEIAGVYCDLLRFPRFGEPFVIQAPDLVSGALFDQRPSLYQTFAIGIQSCLLRRRALEESGLFREDMRRLEDLEFLLRLSRRHRLERIPEPLVNYYETGGVSGNSAAEIEARILLFRTYGYRALFTNWAAWTAELKFYLRGKNPTPW